MSRDALVVGINIYKYSRLPNLSLPSEDAEAIAQLLTHYGGFRVKRLPEAIEDDNSVCVDPEDTVSLKQLKKAIEQLFLPEGEHPPDTALLYFSGHGLRDDSQIKQGYLATSDVNPDEEKWGLSLKWLRQVLEASPIKRKIIWLDCCYSGELLNFKENLEKETNPGNKEGYNRCFITASRAFEVAFEETSGNHGVLTGALLQGLDPTQQPDGWVTNYSLADFINRELEIQTQRPLCHNSGKAIVLTNNQPKKQLGECPYKGLESFNLKDAHFFYGRTGLTDELIKRVEKSNFVAVLGASGSGKSSVLSAGLLYKLKRGEDLLGSDRWQFYPLFNPGEHPLQNLKAAIGKEPDELEQLIATAEAERVVLIVDQFEECFTLCKDEECQRFFDCLLGAVERTGNKLCLVLGMRADFLDKCTQYPKLADKIESENLAIVKPLAREELEEAIMEPAKKVGLQVEPRLVERMIKDVVSSPGRLPLLQDALRELWNQAQKSPDKHLLTLDCYQALDGIEQILERRANKTYDEELKTDVERLVAKRVFLELTNVGEETEVKVTLKSVHKERLVEKVSCGEAKEVVNRAIAVLEKARLIVTSDAGVVSIAHQALISNWERLRQWVEENPEARRKKQKIQAAAEEWQANGKSKGYLLQAERLVEAEGFVQSYADTVPLSSLEQEFVKASRQQSDRLQKERERLRQRIISGLAGGLIVSLSLAGAAGWQWRQASIQREQSEVGRINALFVADSLASEALLSSNLDLEAIVQAIRMGRLLQQSTRVRADTKMRSVAALEKVVYGVRELNRFQGHSNTLTSVSNSPDGKTIASASHDKTIKLWNLDGRELRTFRGHSSSVKSISFSPDGKTIASASDDKTIKLWNLDGRELRTIRGHSFSVNSVSFSPDGKTIASASVDETIKLWNLDGRELRTIRGHSAMVNKVSFSPDGKYIASASSDSTVKLWSLNGREIQTFKGHSNPVWSVIFSPDGKTISSASWDKTIKVWSLDGKELQTFKGHSSDVVSISFSPDGKTIASASWETIRLWSLNGQGLQTIQGYVTSVNFSSDGKTIASASSDTIKLWNLAGKELQAFKCSSRVNSLSFSPDGKTIASNDWDVIKLWSIDGRELQNFKGHSEVVNSVSFSPDGKTIASASDDNTIKLWSLDGRELQTLKGHSENVNSISFSPNGKTMASASFDKTIKLWSLDGQELKTFKGHSDVVTSVSFSPDGNTIASSSSDNTIKLWSLDGKELQTIKGHSAWIASVSFSPDGNTIASASGDSTIKLWSLDGKELQTLKGHTTVPLNISFSPDGKSLASAGADKTIILWNLNLDNLLVRGCNWLHDYLKNSNNGMSKEDPRRHLCDDVKASAR